MGLFWTLGRRAKARKKASHKELASLPVLKTKKSWTKKIRPGISTFGETPSLVGPEHLEGLFEHALENIPEDAVQDTPIFLLATAGVRLLPGPQRQALLAAICDYARSTTKFLLPDCNLHIQAIPGETEGLYGWIAANYLLGGFDSPEEHDHGKGHHTYGFLDMGGASAQIAFAPNATEAEKHAKDLKLLRMRTLDGASVEYRIFVTTWLGFGVNEARKRYIEALLDTYGHNNPEIPDPCLPDGLIVTQKGEAIDPDLGNSNIEPHLLGTGKFSECLARTYPLLDKDAPCEDKPCLLHGVHVPAIDFDVNHFVGVSEFWHTTNGIPGLDHKDEKYDFKTYQNRVDNFCSQDWETILKGLRSKKWEKKFDEKAAREVCFKSSWLINVLHDGIGIPRPEIDDGKNHGHNVTRKLAARAASKGFAVPFQPFDKIADVEVSWTLGRMVLYAASQIPDDGLDMPVGFGSNVKGVPSDFQYAGSKNDPASNSSTGVDGESLGDGNDWHGGGFGLNSSRRIPGFLLFLFILCIAVYLLLGREGRARLFRRFGGRFRRPGGFRSRGPRKLFSLGNTSTNYERLLEGGDGTAEFELAYVDEDNEHSDSSDSSHDAGRSSGWATPRLKTNFTQGSGGYFDNVVTQGQGLGLGPPGIVVSNAMDRSGLVIRTESRERLAPLTSPKFSGGLLSGGPSSSNAGKKSRSGSPSRVKSPLVSPMLPLHSD
ncbi:MAG: Golgi apyrase [Geoglossum umbratile]|nr:MAG: Golgi apyrase [Geoglossum umbratile]